MHASQNPDDEAGAASHPAAVAPEALLAQCQVRRSRGSGPGGQHRNKVETAIMLRHEPTGLEAGASERRSQRDNRQVALMRLRLKLAIEVRGGFASAGADGPTPRWRARCRGGRIACNPQHTDYPALLAEAMDALAEAGWEPGPAADRLGCSSSQLIRLIAHEPHALAKVNEHRAAGHLHPLRKR